MVATSLEYGSAVLMARIVDAFGASVHPRAVAAISYTLYVMDSRRPRKRRPLHGHMAVPLEITEVMFATLQCDVSWTVDVCGYNFRHRIDCSRDRLVASAGARYEAFYLFTPIHGDDQYIRFQLRQGKK